MLPDYDNSIDFSNENIGSIYITGGGLVNREFKGISPDSGFGWSELVWQKQPSRTADFSFSNIDTIPIGLVARCELNIKYMNIQDYIDLRYCLTHCRHFLVRFFNKDLGEWETKDMYCSEQSMNKLFTLKKSLIGVIDLSIKLVGTNLDADKQTYTISYDNNGGSGTIQQKSNINYSDTIKLDSGEAFSKSGYHLSGYNTKSDGTGWDYLPNEDVVIFSNLTLYAKWEA